MSIFSVIFFEKGEKAHDLTHWHNTIEVIRMMEGNMTVVVNGTACPLERDDILIINQQQLHRILGEETTCGSFQRIMIDQDLFTAERSLYEKYVLPAISEGSFDQICYKKGDSITSEMLHVFDEIADLERLQPPAFELREVGLMYILFQRLYQFYKEKREERHSLVNQDILLYRQIVDYICRNYMEKLSLDDIASHGNISRSKCCSIFREYAGRSPIDFLNLYRLRLSADLLKNSNDSIAAVAANCGFGQQSYFNRLFLREYGMTPREYRLS